MLGQTVHYDACSSRHPAHRGTIATLAASNRVTPMAAVEYERVPRVGRTKSASSVEILKYASDVVVFELAAADVQGLFMAGTRLDERL